jgi:hypothetical protein
MSSRYYEMVSGGAETSKAVRERRTSSWLCGRDRFVAVDFFARVGVVTILAAVCGSAAVSAPQDTKDACAPVQAAYQKTASAPDSSSKATNTGGLNVAEAYDKITSEPGHKETCKYLRDETLVGEEANVYSDVFASKPGTANGTVWVSKKNGWVLKREMDVDVTGVGKGHQTIVFEYPKK